MSVKREALSRELHFNLKITVDVELLTCPLVDKEYLFLVVYVSPLKYTVYT